MRSHFQDFKEIVLSSQWRNIKGVIIMQSQWEINKCMPVPETINAKSRQVRSFCSLTSLSAPFKTMAKTVAGKEDMACKKMDMKFSRYPIHLPNWRFLLQLAQAETRDVLDVSSLCTVTHMVLVLCRPYSNVSTNTWTKPHAAIVLFFIFMMRKLKHRYVKNFLKVTELLSIDTRIWV